MKHVERNLLWLGTGVVVLACISSALFANVPVAWACACGCGVFDLGTQSMFPIRPGGMLTLEYDFMDQNRNWSGAATAPAEDNEDRQIRTNFVTLGGMYAFNGGWGVSMEVPFWERLLRSADDDAGAGAIAQATHGAVGDVRVRGTFAGFSRDHSTGISAGLKLPTGDFTYRRFDRDTEIGTGSTDLLLGAYHMAPLAPDFQWGWLAAAAWDQPFAFHGDYRPGSELDATLAAFGSGWNVGPLRLAPVLKAVASLRAHDRGADAVPDDTGYWRAFLAPGFDMRAAGLRVAGDALLPVAQHVNGSQLLAPVLFKLHIARSF